MATGSTDKQVLTIVDFYCAEKKLILEIDGRVHDFYGRNESDLKRQRYLESLGFKILRFTNEEIKGSIEGVLLRISREFET